jgi:hypothetical protein
LFSILIKSFVLIAGLIAFVLPTHARLLTPTEMQDFMGAHKGEIDAIHQKHGLHRGYCVVELAKQRMLNNEFSKEDRFKACSYYGNVILSALNGVGFGGLSKTNQVASVSEHRTTYLALYALGLNLAEIPDAPLLPVTEVSEHKNHYQVCNGLINLGYVIQNDETRSSSASSILAAIVENTHIAGRKSYEAAAFNVGGDLYDKYLLRGARFESEKGIFSDYANELRKAKKRKEAVDNMYGNGAGQSDKFERPAGFGNTFPKPESKPKTPPPSYSPPPSSSPTEPLEPWNGSLYRDLAAATEAMQRGLSEDVCKSTGNLIVRISGQSTYYSSTATLILQSSGTVMAITNAHCVSSDKGAISSVELHIPGCETIFFNKVYMHDLYKKDSTSTGYDVALLKGKHVRAQPIIEMLPSVMTDEMIGGMGYLVSYAAVNYLENGRVKRVSDCARTLSVQTIERLGSAPLHKAEIPRRLQTQDPEFLKSENMSALPIYFNSDSHRLDAAFSFGCSGSPFFVKIGGISFLAGLLDSGIYRIEAGVPTRSASISSIHAHDDWIRRVKLANIKPTYTLS